MQSPARPLSGIKVIEFCQMLAGPFCGCLLADMGAEVIKVEPPDGDLMRAWPPIMEGYSQYFASVVSSPNKVARQQRGGNADTHTQGDYIDVSMLGSMLGIAHLQTSELFGTGRDLMRLGSAHRMNAPYAGFRCRDGDIALAAGTHKCAQRIINKIMSLHHKNA